MPVYQRDEGRHTEWLCKCDCGTMEFVQSCNLGRGSISCGCSRIEHGQGVRGVADTPMRRFYQVWIAMKGRCRNPNATGFKNYGGRGIAVCDEWGAFEVFKEDMWPTYSQGLQIDRIDNNGPYCKENCRWVTHLENRNNTRFNRFVTFMGETMTISQWARRLDVPSKNIYYRLNKGWPVESAMTARLWTRKPK